MSKKTPLYESHLALEATMVDFGGFLMPMRYKATSIVDEHHVVRNDVGMFDTSHMGRIWVKGKDALDFLNLLVPRNVDKLSDNQAGYTFMLNESGGFRDDVIITRFGPEEFMVVCNAGNLEKIGNWLTSISIVWKGAGKQLTLDNRSFTSSMIAVQGPKAISIVEKLAGETLFENRFRVKWITINGQKILYSTTGYTGSSGCELLLFSDEHNIKSKSIELWDLLKENGVIPCALGSRDILRMEAGYRLYGNDIEEDIHLLESGLDFIPFANLKKDTGFIGQNAILDKEINREFIGFKLIDRGIARHGYKLFYENKEIGVVLSGTQSPFDKISFGMALIEKGYKDKEFQIDIRGKMKKAIQTSFPIYDEDKYGIKVRK